jgi:hypothetical protein
MAIHDKFISPNTTKYNGKVMDGAVPGYVKELKRGLQFI